MSVTTERVADLVAPVVERLGLSLYDVDQPGGTLRVMLDREGGIDMDSLAEATRQISRVLDESEPLAGSYTLEVSSPGLERPLRTVEHFAAAVGDQVKVKLHPSVDGPRRADGTLLAADPAARTVTLQTVDGARTVSVDDVTKAHTVFEWSPPPKPGKGPGKPRTSTTESSEDNR